MSGTALWIIGLCIVLIVGPFATLRALDRRKRPPPASRAKRVDDEDDDDKPGGFW